MKLIAFVGKGGVGKSFLSVKEFRKRKNSFLIQVDRQNNAEYFANGMDSQNIYQIEENTLLEDIIGLTPFSEFTDLIRDIAPDFKLILGLMDFLNKHKSEDVTIIADFPPNCETLSILTLPDLTKSIIYRFIEMKDRVANLLKKEKSQFQMKAKVLSDLVADTIDILKTAMWKIVSVPDELSNLEALKIQSFLISFTEERGKIVRVLNKYPTQPIHFCPKCKAEFDCARKVVIEYDVDEVVNFVPAE